MIITVTLNPAVDKTVTINNFTPDSVNRIRKIQLDAGGKGINVAKVLLTLGANSLALGFLAGHTGGFIKRYLDKLNIASDFVYLDGETRTNIKIVDEVNHTNTDINEPGPVVSQIDAEKINDKVLRELADNTILILSGSVPVGMSKDIYYKWIEYAGKRGAKTILDADGELLRLGLAASPYLIKPNIHELEQLAGRKLSDIEEAAGFTKQLMAEHQIKEAVISLGEKGALFFKGDAAIFAEGIPVTVKSTVGAGDSMVAALAYALDNNLSLEKAVCLAVASGTANVMTAGTEPGSLETILALEQKVKWSYLKL
jgi:1-phosphofructokinase